MTKSDHGRFPLGLIIFSACVALFKSFSLSLEMSDSIAMVATLLSLDSPFLGTLLLIASLHALCNSSWLRMVLKVLLAGLLGFYTIHSFVLLALDEYMSLFDLGRYFLEWQVVWSFFDK